jgi:hypothetical protein
MVRAAFGVLVLAAWASASIAGPNLTFAKASVSGSHVAARLSDGRVPSFPDLGCAVGRQAGVDQLQRAPDGRHIGWAVACDTGDETYPVPEEVVVYRAGSEHAYRFGNGLAVVRWRFVSDQRIEICTDTVHGSRSPGCSVYDVEAPPPQPGG